MANMPVKADGVSPATFDDQPRQGWVVGRVKFVTRYFQWFTASDWTADQLKANPPPVVDVNNCDCV